MFKPTYLYIKTHNISGLKYFGKTTKDPYVYRGSGLNWVKHLREFGNNVTTEVVGFYTDKDVCRQAALEFSRKHRIAESSEWANIINETLCGDSGIEVKEILLQKYGPNYFRNIAKSPNAMAAVATRSQKLKGNLKCSAAGKKNIGKTRNKITCPYCGKSGAANTMTRWHFSNCKQK